MTLLLLPFISMFCVYIVVIANLHWKIDNRLNKQYLKNNRCSLPIRYFNRKPFNCESCLSFWISIIFLLTSHFNWFDSLILSGATSYITTVLKRFI